MFTPGRVSDSLKTALGEIGRDDTSADYPWLARIAQFGYPPGYFMVEGDEGSSGVIGIPCND